MYVRPEVLAGHHYRVSSAISMPVKILRLNTISRSRPEGADY